MSDHTCRRGRHALVTALAIAASSMCLVVALPLPAYAVPLSASVAGPDAASILPTVEAFRALLGANNGNAPGSFGSGRREINWDGGGDAAPFVVIPAPNQAFAFRGNITTSPTTAFSGAPLPRFGNLNPEYAEQFQTFSAPRLFGALDSTVLVTEFNVPGDPSRRATTNAFGVIFTDVDIAGATSVEAFDLNGDSIGKLFAEVFDGGLSFVAGFLDTPDIASIRITLGTAALGSGVTESDGVDVVAMDDFIFGEPVPAPAPATLAMLGLGAAMLTARRFARS